MSRPRIIAASLFAMLTLSTALSGCTATTPIPKAPTQSELDELVRIELDRQWGYTGLEGVIARPQLEVERISSLDGFGEEFGKCMGDAGFGSWGIGPSGLDMSTVNPDGAATTPEQQLSYYECNARFPGVDMLSAEQLDFVYAYYKRWLIPCIAQQGYTIAEPPTRQAFFASREQMGWQWSPYSVLTSPPSDSDEYTALQLECKPTIPGIDGWSERSKLF